MNIILFVAAVLLSYFSMETYGGFTLEGYMDQLSLNDTQLYMGMNITEALPVLYCNVLCNGSEVAQITPRNCNSFFPKCKQCRCDDDCVKYDDCCPNENGDVSQTGQSEFRCISSSPGNYFSNCHYMLTSCAGLASVVSDIIAPVTSLDTNITYLNERVAKCRGAVDLIPWDTDEECERTANGTVCSLSLVVPDNVKVRECHMQWNSPDVIDSCNVTGLWDGTNPGLDVADMCFRWRFLPVSTYKYAFKNIYCFMCNGFLPESCLLVQTMEHSVSINFPVMLFPDVTSRDCTEDQWFDPIKKECRFMYCPSGYQPKDQTCVRTNTNLSEIQYNVRAYLVPDHIHRSDPRIHNWSFLEQMTITYIQEELVLPNVIYYYYSVTLNKPVVSPITDDSPSIGIDVIFRAKSPCCRASLEEHMHKVLQTWVMTYDSSEFIFTESEEKLHFFATSNVERYDLNRFGIFEKRIKSSYADNLTAPKEYISLISKYPHCPYIYINADDVDVYINSSVRLAFANFTKHLGIEGHRIMCVDTLTKFYEIYGIPYDAIGRAADLLSMILSALSMLCLTLTFISFSAFPSLRNLPTKNMMWLVVFLFLAQLLLLVGDLAWSNQTMCRVVGVFLHYAWLCVIFWMNVCSYHMFSVFVLDSTKPLTSGGSWKRILKYAVYANGMPLVIVLMTIGISLATSSGSSVGYGNSRCYLSTPLLTGLCFVLPLGIILILNTVFFSVTIWTMSKVHKLSVSVGREQSHIHIYVKLSTLTGIFWILSIIAEIVQLQFLVFVSIVLNASQGIFIFISYIANKRVLQLWRSRFSPTVKHVQSSNETKSTNL